MFVRLLSLLAGAALVAQAAAPSNWDWVSPLPHRQTWVDLTAGANGFVALTDGYGGRKIYHSADGERWEVASVPTSAQLKKVEFANGKYLAVGSSETILASADGIDWQIVHTNSAGGGTVLWDIAQGNGAYVAVGYNSSAIYSKDLKFWSELDFPKGSSLLGIEFGNGVFLAVANSGQVYRSVDGRVWSALPWPANLIPNLSGYEAGLAFNNGVFVMGGNGGGATTLNGLDWTPTPTTTFYRKIVATDSGFIGVSGRTLASSANGADWQTVATLAGSAGEDFYCAAKFGDRCLAGGYAGLLYSSANGSAWSAVSAPVDYSRGNVAYANGRFIRYGDAAGQFVSADGATWNFNTNAPGMISVASGNAVAVGITSENKSAVSTDGTNWQEFALPKPANGKLIAGAGKFIVAADGGVLISADGKSWEFASIPNVQSMRLIGFQNGIFAAMSDTSQPMASSDGRTWTIGEAQIEANAQFYTAGNGRFVGIGGGGMGPGFMTSSTDGLHWQRVWLGSGSTYSYTGLEFGAGYFVMIDGAGGIFYSADGAQWQGDRQAAQPFTGVAYGNGVWIVAGGDSVLRSSDRVTAKSTATLQLAHIDATWSLIVNGSPGERWQIESSAGIGADWSALQTVEIPLAGKITIPLGMNQTAIFRAVIVP